MYILIYMCIYYICIRVRVDSFVMTRILLIIGASRRPGKEPLKASVQEFNKLSSGKWSNLPFWFMLQVNQSILWIFCMWNSPLFLLNNWMISPYFLESNHPVAIHDQTLEFNNTLSTWNHPFSYSNTLYPHEYTPIVPWFILRT